MPDQLAPVESEVRFTVYASIAGVRSGPVGGGDVGVGLGDGVDPLASSATSSITKLVCSELSSTPVNLRVTVWPAYEETSNDFWAYPEFLLRFEYVARVADPTWTVSLSYATEVVVSAVSTCSQKLSEAVPPAGMLTDWDSESVWLEP